MLAARVPTAISRQDLSRLDAASPRRSPRHQRRAVWEDLWDREVVAYAVVSFCYALGQSLYDIFQSQQAKLMTSSLLQRWSVTDEEGYVAAIVVDHPRRRPADRPPPPPPGIEPATTERRSTRLSPSNSRTRKRRSGSSWRG